MGLLGAASTPRDPPKSDLVGIWRGEKLCLCEGRLGERRMSERSTDDERRRIQGRAIWREIRLLKVN